MEYRTSNTWDAISVLIKINVALFHWTEKELVGVLVAFYGLILLFFIQMQLVTAMLYSYS